MNVTSNPYIVDTPRVVRSFGKDAHTCKSNQLAQQLPVCMLQVGFKPASSRLQASSD